ncbi:MAG: efflux RND transporter periplasmic adaptor subunit [Burkholderiaceae bacterium]|nr:efflux RND transporter periplasmic adaptor subunit [Burkholderiaceae bacterium]
MISRPLAALFAAAIAVAAASVAAHGDEDHAQPAAARAVADKTTSAAFGIDDAVGARREADGSLFVPKPVQYRLGVRTRRMKADELAVTVQLSGKVVADPNAGGRVQTSQAGRIEAGPRGLPVLGQRVNKGDVLAWVQPTIGNIERGTQQAELAALDAQVEIAKSRAARYEQLEGAIPRKDVEAAQVELKSLRARRAAVVTGLQSREPLRAPVSGVVSATATVAGQLVESREVLFDIVDPARLAVEALAYDPALVDGVEEASAAVAGRTLALQFVGAGRELRGQALPLLFRAQSAEVPLAIGQPLQVIARTRATVTGIAVPQQALVRNRAGEIVVWVHSGPERFSPRRVESRQLDAHTVVVTSGVETGDRVVVSGASLLAQVR